MNHTPRALWLLPVLALAGTAAYLVWAARPAPPTWTAASPEALEELRLGLAAEEKYYHAEAMAHYRHALGLDPELAIAKLRLLRHLRRDDEEAGRLREELETTDLDRLTERERLLVRYYLLEKEERGDEARELLASYLTEHPEDPYALELECEGIWRKRELEQAEICFEKILEVEPNWVDAQNRLGYLAMAQGDLAQAEDRFRTYRYVAPDQANPHDSLGELLALKGDYEEARGELEEALSIRPDFCISYANLANSALYDGEVELAEEYLRRAREAEGCTDLADRLECRVTDFVLYHERDWEELAARTGDPCHEKDHASPWLPFFAALHTGDEDRIDSLLERASQEEGPGADGFRRALEGLRQTAEGELDEAQASFRAADETVDYWGLGAGMFKLVNRLMWAEAARRAGEEAEAERILGEVEAINPALARAYREGRFPLPPRPPAT